MILAQASAVEPAWLHQAWLFWLAIGGLLLTPAVSIWIARQKQKREVVQGDEFVTKAMCGMVHKQTEDRINELRGRVDRLESDVSRGLHELRSDIQLLVRAVGQLEGVVKRLEAEIHGTK